MRRWLYVVVLCLAAFSTGAQARSGPAEAWQRGNTLELRNGAVGAAWRVGQPGLRLARVDDRIANHEVGGLAPDAFTIALQGEPVIASSQMKLVGKPRILKLGAVPESPQLFEHSAGQLIEIELGARDVHVIWRAILRDDADYFRQEIEIQAQPQGNAGSMTVTRDLPISAIQLLDVSAAGSQVVGSVKGSPVVAGNVFLAFEHPLSTCAAENGRLRCSIKRELPLRAGQSVTYSSVIGVARPGQLRRDFLAYLERERAHPYRTFLHYNSWYDLGYFSQYDEQGALDRINAFGAELTKRGAKLDSFLFDDGWDDPSHLWQFNAGFPDGFTKVREAAAKYGAAPGVWLSPWGGYGKPKQQRVAAAQALGLETAQNGLALSGPKYFEVFRDACFRMIDRYGVNQFKFDGTGNTDRVIPGSRFDSDFDAAITLISELRARKPDIYINLTTGTYPSPFWLKYADSIWRGGEDHDFSGVGSWRQKWITYRDADTYQHVVKAGPLFPLNSLMLHGLIYAQHAKNLDTDPNGDFADEVHDYFATGTQLQEMYITPSLLKPEDWDALAAAAKWSRENADVLKDTHWIGGDPAKLEVYGWAAWSPKKSIITLRNPSDHDQTYTIDIAAALELPGDATRQFRVRSVWGNGETIDVSKTLELKPFEVLSLELEPQR